MNRSFSVNFNQKKVYDKKNKLLWVISGFLFDIDFEKITWCVYKKWFLKYWYFLFEDILSIEDDFFIINKFKKSKEFYEIIWKIVKNEDGRILWSIDDVEFDITNKLKYIYVDCWYSFLINTSKILQKNISKISKKAILSYEKDCVIIKDKQSIKENKKTLENISKIFINIPTPNYNINLKKYE